MPRWNKPWSSIALLACGLLLFGCVKPQRSKVQAPPPLQRQGSQQSATPAPAAAQRSRIEQKLGESAGILERLVLDPKNSIPDAILNRTTCFTIFPDFGRGITTGFASCRNNAGAWTSPAVATLSRPPDEQVRGDLLIFFFSARARKALLDGNLAFGESLTAEKGVLEAERPIVDQVELSRDALAYVQNGKDLQGFTLTRGSIAINDIETANLYGHSLNVRTLLDNSTMSSTVTSFFTIEASSFFNTISPAGIIIHHSVLIPARHLPEPERALDRFHYSRGFEISCFGKTYHIAYHYLILPNGEVRTGRPDRCEGAHARGYNSYLGIALVGDFSSSDNPRGRKGPRRPTSAQLKSLVRLCRALREKYNIPLQHILPHSQVSRTECPGDGFSFGTILAALERPSNAGL